MTYFSRRGKSLQQSHSEEPGMTQLPKGDWHILQADAPRQSCFPKHSPMKAEEQHSTCKGTFHTGGRLTLAITAPSQEQACTSVLLALFRPDACGKVLAIHCNCTEDELVGVRLGRVTTARGTEQRCARPQPCSEHRHTRSGGRVQGSLASAHLSGVSLWPF